MIYLSIALVIIAGMAFYLVNKYLDQKHQLNTMFSEENTVASLQEQLKKFDERINNTWGSVSLIKEEINAIKLASSFKGNNR